jgi:hypothetical protein
VKDTTGKPVDVVTALRLGRDRLRAERDRAAASSAQAAAPSTHDLMPLDLAARVIFRRVYADRSHGGMPTRMTAHLDALAYTIAELAPIYVYEANGHALRAISREDLSGGLFQEGARALAYIDGRRAVRNLAFNATSINAVIQTLMASSNSAQDAQNSSAKRSAANQG